jgi:hypothetical protein
MRPEDLSDERLDEALRRQPRWEPPRHFVQAVVARMPAMPPALPSSKPSLLPVIMDGVTIGVSGAAVAYVAGVLMSQATPVLIENPTAAAWIIAAVALSIAASVTGVAQEWI